MHPEKSCKNCSYAVLFTQHQKIQSTLLCNFGPPHLLITGVSQNGAVSMSIARAPVPENHWCFQFKAGEPYREVENIPVETKNTLQVVK